MAFRRSRTGVSLRADLRSDTSDFSLSLSEVAFAPMTSFTSRAFWERVNRSMGFSARGSKGHWPLSWTGWSVAVAGAAMGAVAVAVAGAVAGWAAASRLLSTAPLF